MEPVKLGSAQEQTVNPKSLAETDMSAHRLANAFLHQRYPLTKDGEELKAQVKQIATNNNPQELNRLTPLLPTVENPRLELFKDFDLTPEQERSLFGLGLETIQVTKGCRHKCDFCIVGAEAKVQTMPFAAVLKIAEKMPEGMREADNLWRSWITSVKEDTGIDFTKVNSSEVASLNDEKSEFSLKIREAFSRHPISDVVHKQLWDVRFLLHPGNLLRHHITNFYDSDVFDYRDTTFPHADGTPADYGDVIKALASRMRPIHITTAGWPRADKVAQRAAEKIVSMDGYRELTSQTRISINKFEYRAKRDLEEYLEDMKNVIYTLRRLVPQILLFYEKDNPEDQEFIKKVIEPLTEFIDEGIDGFLATGFHGDNIKLGTIVAPRISYFSGPLADEEHKDDHHDVAACMPGTHIWPDGTIAIQKKDPGKPWNALRGSRPTPTGEKLYSLK